MSSFNQHHPLLKRGGGPRQFSRRPPYPPDSPIGPRGTVNRLIRPFVSRTVIPANSIPLTRILNLALFSLVFLLILYLNLPSFSNGPSKSSYDWARIRYRSPNPIPPAHGGCPGLKKTTKPVLVVARISSENDDWLEPLKNKYHLCVYTSDAVRTWSSAADRKTNHREDTTSSEPLLETPANRAHEALPYLTFIIDNYASLPGDKKQGIVFIHGSRFAWHNDHPEYDNLELLQALNIPNALADTGYANLKCDWAASTCPKDGVDSQAGWANQARKVIEPWNTKVISDADMARSMKQIFGAHNTSPSRSRTKLSASDIVRSQCCAQFVVARNNILQHTRDEYIALRQWLLDAPAAPAPAAPADSTPPSRVAQSAAAHPDDRVAGRIMSYLWHILFLPRDQVSMDMDMIKDSLSSSSSSSSSPSAEHDQQLSIAKLNQLACPSASHCYCRLYGRCDLHYCREDGSRCDGQYLVPPAFRVPDKKGKQDKKTKDG